jgi:hypothetical protein
MQSAVCSECYYLRQSCFCFLDARGRNRCFYQGLGKLIYPNVTFYEDDIVPFIYARSIFLAMYCIPYKVHTNLRTVLEMLITKGETRVFFEMNETKESCIAYKPKKENNI